MPVATLQYTYLWSTGDTGQTFMPSQPGRYSVTVSDGYSYDTASIVVTMEGRYWEEFYPVTITSNMVAGDSRRQFEILLYSSEINAYAYEVQIELPNGREHVLRGDTTSGFQKNGIHWDGRLENGNLAPIRECRYMINLMNCAHPFPDPKVIYFIHLTQYFAGPNGITTEEVGFEETNSGSLKITERIHAR
jgi:hypothetical protein